MEAPMLETINMTSLSQLVFEPLLPFWVLALCLIPILLTGLLNRKLSRVLLALILLGVLSGPTTERTTLVPEKDVVAVVTDISPSNQVAQRIALTDEALERIKTQLENMPHVEPLYISATGSAAQGTNIFRQMQSKLQSIPTDRLSAIITLTDGEVTDLPNAADLPAPVHMLNTTPADSFDRRLIVHQAPAFALLDKPQTIILEVEDARNNEAEITVTLGENETKMLLPTNSPQEIEVTFDHAGTNALRLETPVLEGEITARNNQATQLVTGVRENLNVLLVSGLPHNGSRVILNLLKSDPSDNLVHFTILRTVGKHDPTPNDQLSLIPFPVEDLFEKDLEKFDLIVFDRYFRRNFLADQHFENIKQHIKDGHALLVLAGPDYNTRWGLANTPLKDILPATPFGEERKGMFRPTLSNVGKRHPITAPFAETAKDWGRMAAINPTRVSSNKARTLMTGSNGLPLMLTDEIGDGRMGIWLSSNWWFWNRGIDGGGPQTEVLRRLTHWLMRQPELEEKRLDVSIANGQMTVTYNQVDAIDSMAIEVITPQGESTNHTLTADDEFSTTIPAGDDGLYTVRAENGILAYGVKGNVRDLEWRSQADMGALQNLVTATGGSFTQLEEGKNIQLRRVTEGSNLSGPGWVGLPKRDSATQTGSERSPLIPAWLGLALILLGLALTWWLEAVVIKRKRSG